MSDSLRKSAARRTWDLLWTQKRLLLSTICLLPLATLARLAQPYLVKLAIDGPISEKRLDSFFVWLCVGYLMLLLAEMVLRSVQTYVTELAGQRLTHGLRRRLLAHLQTLSTRYFERHPVGSLMTRVTSDVEALNEFISDGIATLLADLLLLAGILGVLLWMDWRLALVSFLVLPPLLWLVNWIAAKTRESYVTLRKKIAEFNARLQENISGMSLIQAFNAEGWALGRHRELNLAQTDGEIMAVRLSSLLSAAVQLAENLALAAVLWQASGAIAEQRLTFGVLVAFIDYIRRFFEPIERLTSRYTVFQQALTAAERIFALLDVDEVMPRPEQPRLLPGGPQPLRFERVGFSYDGKTSALEAFDLEILPGQSVALVGATGAGKSTVVKLLLRFYDPTQGRILLGGVDLREAPLDQLRSRIAVVHQDVFLFSGSIEFNLTLGKPVDFEAAAHLVQADAFIRDLPEGYQTKLGERGAGLSSGELQLLSFARALARDPEILILDEATASVDSGTEARLQAAIETMLEGRTSVIVAHRLSTIRKADKIVVLHHGRIHEMGTHEELLERKGLYWHLYHLQFQPS